MATPWTDVPIGTKLFTNVDPVTQQSTLTGQENSFVTEANAHARFPGLKLFVDLPGNEPVYVKRFKGNLLASTGKGRTYRIGRSGDVEDVTKVALAGGKRPIFAETEDGMAMAAGGPILLFNGKDTDILSKEAPNTTHVGFIDSYLIAIEAFSGRFYHANAGDIDTWDPLNVFSADGQPDDLNAVFITPFRELLLTGEYSIEQFERLQSGDTPFFRRWSVGEGIFAPYTLTFADNAVWGINQDKEFTRYSGQTSNAGSGDAQQQFHAIDNWDGAWAERINVVGQTFIILQMPFATTPYGTKGMTFIRDVRSSKWTTLFGWDAEQGLPTRWPGWSHEYLWGKNLVGGNGAIYELDGATYTNAGVTQRVLGRTAHLSNYEIRVDNLRLRVKRGVGGVDTIPEIMLRCNRDNRGFGPWKRKGLGKQGDRLLNIEFGGYGCGHSFQFEWIVTDACQVEIAQMEWQTTAIGE
jgi:hypothetical protein